MDRFATSFLILIIMMMQLIPQYLVTELPVVGDRARRRAIDRERQR